MVLPLWKINPEELIKDNISTNKLSCQKERNIRTLIQVYKETSAKIYEISKMINEQNFVDQLMIFYDLEAYLAELYFYLDGGIELLELEKDIDIIDMVNQDYILSYSCYLEDNYSREIGSLPLVRMWLDKEKTKAFKNRFVSWK